MNPSQWTRRIAALLGTTLLVAACGGGGGVDTGGTGAPLSFTRGSIAGFGSVIVNAVRFDDSSASIVDDDGNRLARSALALGMTTEIDAGSIRTGTTGATATASRIRVSSEIVGPVQAVDTAAQTVTVLGQVVRVNTATVFDSALAGRLTALTVGAVLEVYALPDATSGSYLATRIEPKSSADAWRLRGVVAGLDTAAERFRVGGITVSYAALGGAPAGLANGRIAKLRLETTPVGGVYTALRVDASALTPSDRDEAQLEGLVTEVRSATRFFVDGVEVDAVDAVFEDGAVALGSRVEVEGALVGGVLVAAKVEIEDEDESSEFELEGSIASIDTATQTFVLQGFTVSYAGTVRYDDGTEADLGAGVEVEVRGTLVSGDKRLVATRIQFD
jgi:surface antigen